MAAESLELLVLGPLEARVGGRVVALRARRQRTLLAALLVRLGEVVSTDRLVDDIWGERPPATARHALQVYVSELRKALPQGVLVTHPAGYRLKIARDRVDALRFEQLVADARSALAAADTEGAAARLREGVALWRGPAFADVAYEPVAQTEIARLEELRRDAVELRVDTELALGRTDLGPELEALVAEEPLRERRRAQLMLALYRSGRQADALAAYREARQTLVEELGVEPGPELRELEAAILRQDPALSLAAPAPETPAQRKLATILFADLVDSTSLALSLDPETLRDLLQRYFEAAAAAVVRHGGTLEKFIGDAVMAVFGSPLAHEDDALRAARAAIELRDAVARLSGRPSDLAVRIGLATGEIVAGGARLAGGPLVTGPAVALAARLEQSADPGTIAVDALTRKLTGGAATYTDGGDLVLRGLPAPVRVHALTAVAADAPALARRLDAPLVGRRRELDLLTAVAGEVARDEVVRTVALLGPPGIGKTRLARELAARLGGAATVRAGRCLSYGVGSAFEPLRGIVGSRAAALAALADAPDAEVVADHLAAALAPDAAVPADEIPWAFRRYCEALAANRPLLLVVDDLHWAAQGLLDVIEQLATHSSGAPILLVCAAREELADIRPSLLASAEVIELEPLSGEETDALVDHLLPDSALTPETRARIVAAAEGNPLFLEQLAAHAAETGTLEPPPTLRALLASRLDRLGPGERGVLVRVAAVGREATAADVTTLLDAATAPTAATHLQTLIRRGFLRATEAGAFRFRHGLIQDAVYRAAPKELRAELHERYAEAIAARDADDETIGYHLERAVLLRREIEGAAQPQLELRAGRALEAAAARATEAGDMPGAAMLLERAARVYRTGSVERAEVMVSLIRSADLLGDPARAEAVIAEALELAAATGDPRLELHARVNEMIVRAHDRETTLAAAIEVARSALTLFGDAGDDYGSAKAWRLVALAAGAEGRAGVTVRALRRQIVHARRAGRSRERPALGFLAGQMLWGPTPVRRALADCESLLGSDDASANRLTYAEILGVRGVLEAMAGAAEQAAATTAVAVAELLELGSRDTWLQNAARVDLLLGHAAVAERHAVEVLSRPTSTDASVAAEARVHLAEALYLQERYDEAEAAVGQAAIGPGCDLYLRAAYQMIFAKLAAVRGEDAVAEQQAAEAVASLDRTDLVNARADALATAAEIELLGERQTAAAAMLREAEALYARKGNVVSPQAVRKRLERLARRRTATR